ncbi:MAG: hypothetical protein GC161_17200 [Planctomycetaceae bacterium]|nr:hypothetical protein [Planctomycetaceae bacterium]
MSKSVSYLLFAACLAICTLSSGSAWRTLSGAWQGPWSLTAPMALSVAAANVEADPSAAIPVPLHVAARESLATATVVASREATVPAATAEPRAPAVLSAAVVPSGADVRASGARLALTFE